MASEIIKFRVAAGEKLQFVNVAQNAGMTVSDLVRRAGQTWTKTGTLAPLQ